MNLRDYLADTAAPGGRVLEDWRWLLGPDLQLWYVTKAGSALLRNPADGSVHFLDVAAGTVERIAANVDGFKAAVVIPENLQRWLMRAVVDQMRGRGIQPGTNQCFSFKQPPVLGGAITPENMELCDIAVHFSIAGQIHRQVKDLPPGTKIRNVKIR